MKRLIRLKTSLAVVVAVALLSIAAGQAPAQTQAGEKGSSKKDEKKLDKEARKLANKADEASKELGRDGVFCILAAHTDVGTAEELRTKYNSLTDFPFGQFVAAVLMADRIDDPDFSFDVILNKLKEGMSLGQIAKEAKENIGELRHGFGQFRSELARSMTNPPTKNCFASGS